MLKKGTLLILGFAFGDCDQDIYEKTDTPIATPSHVLAGARANDTALPIGGGPGYDDQVDPATARHVRTFNELEAALNERAPVIYVDDDAEIDMRDRTVIVPAGTTLASGRGRDGSKGGMLYTNVEGSQIMLRIEAGRDEPIRITGLRIRGNDPNERAPTCDNAGRGGIALNEPNVRADASLIRDRKIEIDNNEIFAWKTATLFEGARGVHVHHNHFHHNRRHAHRLDCAIQLEFHAGGYGVTADIGHTLIVANFFQYNRHAIASGGRTGASYEAYYNLVLGPNVSHSFDMHGGVDREDGTYIAGDTMIIAYNSLLDPDRDAVNVRGWPNTGAWVFGNEFRDDVRKTVLQTKIPLNSSGFEYGRMYVFENVDDVKDAKWFTPPPSTPVN